MTNDKLIELFYHYRSEIMRGLWKFNIQLDKDKQEDAEQDTILRLLKYNGKTEIDESQCKNLFFITWKNVLLNTLNGNTLKKYDINKHTYHTTEGDISEIEDYIDYFHNADDTFVDEYREKALELISEEDYKYLIEHFTSVNNKVKITPSMTRRLTNIKKMLNLQTTYELTIDAQYIDTYTTISEIATAFKIPHGHLNKKMSYYGNEFDYKGERWVIRKKTNIK